MEADIVIVGGGLAGAAAAESYRKAGGEGTVTILSQEPTRPVHRPPLSKEYLRGDETLDNVYVHPESFYADNRIDLRLETRVTGLDLARKTVQLHGGETVSFSQLVLATGARPRRLSLPGADLPGVHYLRSLASSDALRADYGKAERAVIIGAGFIGMEVASTLVQRGVRCTVVEMAPWILPRIMPERVARAIQRQYEAHGVRFVFGTGVDALEGAGRVERVTLASGEALEADLVVAGVGAVLNTDLASEAGLEIDGGVVVDATLRTSHPDVLAIGDIAAFPDPVAGRIHAEHWDNALNQGRAAGKILAGGTEPYDHVAYFFSDMFDLSLNMVGYSTDWDDVILRGDPDSGSFTCVYVKDGTVRAALMLNDDAYMDAWSALIRDRRPVHDGLARPDVDPSGVTAA